MALANGSRTTNQHATESSPDDATPQRETCSGFIVLSPKWTIIGTEPVSGQQLLPRRDCSKSPDNTSKRKKGRKKWTKRIKKRAKVHRRKNKTSNDRREKPKRPTVNHPHQTDHEKIQGLSEEDQCLCQEDSAHITSNDRSPPLHKTTQISSMEI